MDTQRNKIVVFHCRNLRLFSNGGQKDFLKAWPNLSLIAVPCSGKIEAHFLLKTLASGAQGTLVLGCAEKACQYLEGSMRSRKRVDYARYWLDKIGIASERIEFVRIWPVNKQALEALLKEFTSKLQSLGALGAPEKV
ncbi:MAG: hydrogenase iron-sulfur subunit [Deltaproteobacteria bacterium]|nr:hydrogenase iron-sulfur subunit [Deltaproteobacteria bacterium]